MEGFERRVMMRFEDLHGTVRLSFEAVEALRESTERNFAEVRADHTEQITQLHSAIRISADGLRRLRSAMFDRSSEQIGSLIRIDSTRFGNESQMLRRGRTN
jgi:hypothetical protein